MLQYLDTLRYILDHGARSDDRTGVGTISCFGLSYRHDLSKGFPLLTTKRMPLKTIATELVWFLQGRTDSQWLQERGCHIWDEWATKEQCARFGREEGDLGPIYGWAWRYFGGHYISRSLTEWTGHGPIGFDQISWVIDEIKRNPNSRRLIVSAWNPEHAQQVSLPPCHTLFQFYVREGKLSCQLYQRSADFFLGVPFNLASYALLTHMVAQVTGLQVGEFIHVFGDAHIYLNHLEQVREQLSREPRSLPTLRLKERESIFDFTPEDVDVEDYNPCPAIKAPVAV